MTRVTTEGDEFLDSATFCQLNWEPISVAVWVIEGAMMLGVCGGITGLSTIAFADIWRSCNLGLSVASGSSVIVGGSC